MTGPNGDDPISIRETTVEDVPVILQFIKDIAAFEKLSGEVVATEEIITETLFGEKPSAKVILAEIGGKQVGYAVYFYNFSTFTGRPGLYVEDIFVSEESRGTGAGEAMMRYLASLAKRENCGRIEFAVLDWNPARRFYEKLGAESMEDWLLYRISGSALDELAGD